MMSDERPERDDRTFDFLNPDGSIRGMVWGDPWQTEVEAARAILPHLSKLRARIYRAFMERPEGMTDCELERLPEFRDLAETTASKRRTELFQAGALKAVGTRKNQRGRTMTVWAISPHNYQERQTPRAREERTWHCDKCRWRGDNPSITDASELRQGDDGRWFTDRVHYAICPRCFSNVSKLPAERCAQCGEPLPEGFGRHGCPNCLGEGLA